MGTVASYPKKCRPSIQTLMNEIGVCPETAYGMMLMTAALMDLQPEDDDVVRMILEDCGIEDSETA